MEFGTISEKEFIEFENTYQRKCFMQTVQMGTLREKKGWKIEYVALRDKQQIIATAMLLSYSTMMGFRIYHALRGFLIDYKNKEVCTFFLKELKQYLKKKKCLYFYMDPYIPYVERDIDGNIVENGFSNKDIMNMFSEFGFLHEGFTKGFDEDKQVRWMFVLPLKNKDKDTILKEMSQQTRRSIQRSYKYGVQVEELAEHELDVFTELMQHTGKRKGFIPRDLSYYQEMYEAFGKEHIKYVVAKLNIKKWLEKEKETLARDQEEYKQIEAVLKEGENSKKHLKRQRMLLENIEVCQKKISEVEQLLVDGEELILAGGMFVLYGEEIIYLAGGSYSKYKQFSGSYAVQWHMIQEAMEKGYEIYNFYGISGIFDETAPDYGVYTFKRGFGGRVVELVGSFMLPVHKFWFMVYKILKKVKK
ncbi:MAG: aminoacyltransferase [Erysipelotrichaceae bacterium]|nr:aminoacyltransferase [Erysipelotrichaceae bacterium]